MKLDETNGYADSVMRLSLVFLLKVVLPLSDVLDSDSLTEVLLLKSRKISVRTGMRAPLRLRPRLRDVRRLQLPHGARTTSECSAS